MIAKIFLFFSLLTISSISTANNILCAYDLNQDGALDDEGEIRSCVDGNCPLQRVACNTTKQKRIEEKQHQCIKGSRWRITDRYKCPYTGKRHSSRGSCENKCIEKIEHWDEIDICPLGDGHQCVNYQGSSTKSCSKIACKKQASTTSSIFNASWHQDDGAKNAAGQCTDQTLLFSGKPSSCNLSGSKTAFKNCCVNKTGLTSTDSSGASLEEYGKMKAIYAVLAAAKAGVTAAAAGSSAAAAMKTSLKASFDPTTLAISVGVYLVMDYLAKACGKQDMETAIMKDSGLCVEVGTYCSEEWEPFGCVQKTTGFCCFNSKIARIFHEQGRSQLTSFNNNSFGTAQAPDCRGYTPEEFSALDFDKIDLDEYVQDIQNKPNSVDLNAQITQKTQQLEQDL